MLEAYWMPVPAAKGIFRNRWSGTCQPQRCHVPGLGFLWWANAECGGDKIWIVLRSLALKDIKSFFRIFDCFFDVISVPGHATSIPIYLRETKGCLHSEAGRAWHRRYA